MEGYSYRAPEPFSPPVGGLDPGLREPHLVPPPSLSEDPFPSHNRPPAPRPALPSSWDYATTRAKLRPPWARIRIAVALLAALTLGVLGLQFVTRPTAGTALALVFSPGQTERYRLHTTLDGSIAAAGRSVPFHVEVEQVVGWRVRSVDADGVADVDLVTLSLSGTAGGKPLAPATLPKGRIRIAPDGRLLAPAMMAMTGGDSIPVPGADQLSPLLPDHPVRVGDRWAKNFDLKFPLGTGSIGYRSDNYFVRSEEVQGVDAAVITSSIRMPLDLTVVLRRLAEFAGDAASGIPPGADPRMGFDGDVDLHMTAWLDPVRGRVLRSTAEGNFGIRVKLQGFRGVRGFDRLVRDAGGRAPTLGFVGRITVSTERLTGRPEPAGSELDRQAQALLRHALAAARVRQAERGSYAGSAPGTLAEVDPTLAFVTSKDPAPGTVSVRGVTAETIVLVTRSRSGRTFCIAHKTDAGPRYGTQDARKFWGCRGGW